MPFANFPNLILKGTVKHKHFVSNDDELHYQIVEYGDQDLDNEAY